MSQPFYAVIMAGGRGERFWPASTSRRPKQLLDLVGGRALIGQAVDRLAPFIPARQVFVVTNVDLLEATRAVLPELPPENVVGEPMGRDTAAAATLGCALVAARDPAAAFCILTADQVMGDLPVFRNTLEQSLRLALEQDVLITIGMQPLHPDTGFGYIRAGAALGERKGIAFFRAAGFEEKPALDKAVRFLEEGNYFWNSGMFIWSVASFRHALTTHCPHLATLLNDLLSIIGTPAFEEGLRTLYAPLVRISIDFALMEKAENIVMARGTFAWDDVGSWPALAKHFPPDAQGNVVMGDAELLDATGNIVLSKGHLTACIGVHDLVVVQAPGVTLVCPRDRAQDIKQLVKRLAERGDCGHLI